MNLSTPQLFIILGLIGILTETIIGVDTGFDLLLIGTILLSGGGLGLLTNSSLITLITSVTFTCLYLFLFRGKLRKKLIKATHHTNVDKLIGQKGVVVRTITPNTPGLVRVDDEDWRATAASDAAASDAVLYEKTPVVVEAIEGVTLRVAEKK